MVESARNFFAAIRSVEATRPYVICRTTKFPFVPCASRKAGGAGGKMCEGRPERQPGRRGTRPGGNAGGASIDAGYSATLAAGAGGSWNASNSPRITVIAWNRKPSTASPIMWPASSGFLGLSIRAAAATPPAQIP